MIELESPRVPIFGAKGQFLKEARKAQDQIATWRNYIAQNPDQAQKSRQDGGLGARRHRGRRPRADLNLPESDRRR